MLTIFLTVLFIGTAGNILKDAESRKKLSRLEIDSICLSMVSAGLDTFANSKLPSGSSSFEHPAHFD